jgi:hypothetical protein
VTSPPVIAPIVEGHGEVSAVREIVTRIGLELLGGTWIEVAQPFRLDSGKMRKPDELAKAIRIAAARVQGPGGVLVLRDGDDADVDCPVQLADMLRPGLNLVSVGIEIVVAYQEYESWFLAAPIRCERIRTYATMPSLQRTRRAGGTRSVSLRS